MYSPNFYDVKRVSLNKNVKLKVRKREKIIKTPIYVWFFSFKFIG